jgi:hypothetical protein
MSFIIALIHSPVFSLGHPQHYLHIRRHNLDRIFLDNPSTWDNFQPLQLNFIIAMQYISESILPASAVLLSELLKGLILL